MRRVQKKIEACRHSSSEFNQSNLDINALCSQSLLQFIYVETLRLRIALIVIRIFEQKKFKIEE